MPIRLARKISALFTDPVKALQAFNMMRFGTTLLIGIWLAKSGLSTVEISMYETWLFLGNIVTFFWMGGGQNALISLFPKLEGEEQQRILLFQSTLLFTLLALVAAGTLAFAGHWIGPRFAHAHEVPFLAWLCLFVIGNIPSQLVHLFYLLREQPRQILIFGVIGFGSQLAAVVVPIVTGLGLEGIFISLVAWATLKYAWLLILVIRNGKWSMNLSQLGRYAWLMVPLTLHILVGNSVEYTDGLIVANFFTDERQFAIFRFGAREFPLTMLLVGGIVTGLIPVAAKNLAEGMQELRKRTARLAHLLYPLSAVLMILSPVAFPLIYNDDFLVSAKVFNVYLLILSSRILLPQVLVISQDRNFMLVISAVVETLINVGLSLWWVRYWGLEGIAIASVVAFLVNKFNLIAYNYWVLGVPMSQYIPIRLWGFYTTALVAVFLLVNWING